MQGHNTSIKSPSTHIHIYSPIKINKINFFNKSNQKVKSFSSHNEGLQSNILQKNCPSFIRLHGNNQNHNIKNLHIKSCERQGKENSVYEKKSANKYNVQIANNQLKQKNCLYKGQKICIRSDNKKSISDYQFFNSHLDHKKSQNIFQKQILPNYQSLRSTLTSNFVPFDKLNIKKDFSQLSTESKGFKNDCAQNLVPNFTKKEKGNYNHNAPISPMTKFTFGKEIKQKINKNKNNSFSQNFPSKNKMINPFQQSQSTKNYLNFKLKSKEFSHIKCKQNKVERPNQNIGQKKYQNFSSNYKFNKQFRPKFYNHRKEEDKENNLKRQKQSVSLHEPAKKQKSRQQKFQPRKFPSFLMNKTQKSNVKAICLQDVKFTSRNHFSPRNCREPIKNKDQKNFFPKHVKSMSTFEKLNIVKDEPKQQKKNQLFKSFENQQKNHDQMIFKKQQNKQTKVFDKKMNLMKQSTQTKYQKDDYIPQKATKNQQRKILFHQNQHNNSIRRQNLEIDEVESRQSIRKSQNNSDTIINHLNFQQKQVEVQSLRDKIEKEKKNQRQEPLIKNLNKQSIMEDIKQVLINCDLFSQEVYKNVLEEKKKEQNDGGRVLKQNNRSKVVKFQHRTSLKDLIDDVDSSYDERRSSEEKRLAQMASISQQKRSKWILEQRDTIKESLKELSQFNTQKSFAQNQWKKFSFKDLQCFSKNAHRPSRQFLSKDNIKQQAYYQENFQSKYQSQVIISNKSESSVSSKTGNLVKLEDFSLRWLNEQPIIFPCFIYENQNHSVVTYWAQHKKSRLVYTIKKYSKSIFQTPITGKQSQYLDIFIKKLKIQMFEFNHPNIQKVYDIFDDRDNIYVLGQFIEKKLSDVFDFIEKQDMVNGSQEEISLSTSMKEEKNKVMLFYEVVNSLEEIHLHDILHKAFQPVNIALVFNCCKISGFDNCDTSSKGLKETICTQYTSPEALFNSKKTAVDIWSLGILAYELFVGKKPFYQQSKEKCQNQHETKRKILQCNIAQVPQNKKQICQQLLKMCLKRDPKERKSIFEIKSYWQRKITEYNHQNKFQKCLTQQINQLFVN